MFLDLKREGEAKVLPFKTAAELKIAPVELAALEKALVALESGAVEHAECVGVYLVHSSVKGLVDSALELPAGSTVNKFQMYSFYSETSCGTAACIAGWAEFLGGLEPFRLASARIGNPELGELFDPAGFKNRFGRKLETVQPAEAAAALRNYLTYGEARWAQALVV